MKKIAVTTFLFCSALFFAQKSLSYIKISYGSICCGTPSTKPVMDYLKKFEKTNQLGTFEVLKQGGMGREGEFNLYIGTNKLGKKQKKMFAKGLQSIITSQNKARKQDSDGTVDFDPAVTVYQSDLTGIKNLTIYKK
ncbi:hypothetical protein ACM46_10720 [Chryseobacterium angstadtii]|uniref:Uncharacterized protein n=1 Tax=Chryseobacterium angstadtii TaxID=558151 RepID=A0A0J7IGU0_9FLAO|nr:hypothetical protein [Chryseobacterium angstadtii]KMQ65206.1 hypothetical protein ACM46_10720 [Chryseobacterium angstadtii]